MTETHALATTRGKEYALTQLKNRREANEGKERKRNDQYPAGWPMYYYCISCDDLADTKPEGWFMSGSKKLCEECQSLKDLGWLE